MNRLSRANDLSLAMPCTVRSRRLVNAPVLALKGLNRPLFLGARFGSSGVQNALTVPRFSAAELRLPADDPLVGEAGFQRKDRSATAALNF